MRLALAPARVRKHVPGRLQAVRVPCRLLLRALFRHLPLQVHSGVVAAHQDLASSVAVARVVVGADGGANNAILDLSN